MAGYVWTQERLHLLVHYRDEMKLSWPRIGMALSIATERARVKYREVKGLAFEERRRGARPSDDPPRVTAQPVNIAQRLLGDPAPGRSALDRKRQAEACS